METKSRPLPAEVSTLSEPSLPLGAPLEARQTVEHRYGTECLRLDLVVAAAAVASRAVVVGAAAPDGAANAPDYAAGCGIADRGVAAPIQVPISPYATPHIEVAER